MAVTRVAAQPPQRKADAAQSVAMQMLDRVLGLIGLRRSEERHLAELEQLAGDGKLSREDVIVRLMEPAHMSPKRRRAVVAQLLKDPKLDPRPLVRQLTHRDRLGHKSRLAVVAELIDAAKPGFTEAIIETTLLDEAKCARLDIAKRQKFIEGLSAPRPLQIPGSSLVYHVQSVTEDARVRKFKEPWTVEWMRSLPRGAVLYDVGANIGITALLAAEDGDRRIQVVAVEPFPANYASLIKNIAVNRLDDRVVALPIGLGRRTCVVSFHWSTTEPGGSLHSFDEVTQDRAATAPAPFHHCLCYAFDDLAKIGGLPFPTHIKIDVDGGEVDLLKGAADVLRDKRCEALQIEATDVDATRTSSRRVVEQAQGAGFVVVAEHVHNDPQGSHGRHRVTDIQFARASPTR